MHTTMVYHTCKHIEYMLLLGDIRNNTNSEITAITEQNMLI